MQQIVANIGANRVHRRKAEQNKNRPLPLTPEHQASIWADYTWHKGALEGFGIGFGARYIGETDNIAIGSMGYVADAASFSLLRLLGKVRL